MAAAAAASLGTTCSTKLSGTSQTPLRTRTGLSRLTGVPSTRTRAQLRVSVIDVRAGAKPGLLALGGRVELALETLGHLGQLDVRETVVVDGRQPPDRGAGGDQDEDNEQTGREAKPLHRTGL